MDKVAIVFPGQGSQSVGMGRSLYDGCPSAKHYFDEANEVLGYDLRTIIFDGPEEELNLTSNTQPALLVAGIGAYHIINENTDIAPALFAGHSLGEYTALVAAGVLGFKDAVRLVHLRGKYMQEAVPEGTGLMSAIIGLDAFSVDEICKESSSVEEVVVSANINGLSQVVVSGDRAAVERAGVLATERGAKKVVPLKVSVPSHSPLMEGAATKFAEEIERIEFNDFEVPVVTNVEAMPLDDTIRVGELLKRQLTSPVRWVETVQTMKLHGIDTVIEAGPGKVLSSLTRRIEREIRTFNVSGPEDIDALTEEV